MAALSSSIWEVESLRRMAEAAFRAATLRDAKSEDMQRTREVIPVAMGC